MNAVTWKRTGTYFWFFIYLCFILDITGWKESGDKQTEVYSEAVTVANQELIAESHLSAEERMDRKIKKRKVYLTFDDGPGKYTEQILDILKEYDIKATFFVVGKNSDYAKKMYRRICEEGHTLGIHAYSHDYDKIYDSLEAFDRDFNKISNLLYDVTGKRVKYYRFPGGSSNTVSEVPIEQCIRYLDKHNIMYFDWNAENGDATGITYTPEELVGNVMEGVALNRNSIVLMHDASSASENTAESLPLLIETLEEEGYTLLPITQYTKTVQHVTLKE